MRMPSRFFPVLILFSVINLCAMSGCLSIKYYGQAVYGQCKILTNRKSINKIIADKDTPKRLKERLSLVLDIRDYAIDELKLPGSKNYLTYVDLKQPYAIWNVFATPEFSLTPKKWCYPVVGCCAYRGYFSEQNALDYADTLEKQGYDVFVGGVTAYSTLGWFNDPVLNTFINFRDTKLAALIFHELAHNILYVSDHTAFNESFATAVEQEGIRRWMTAHNNPSAINDYMIDSQRHLQFIKLIMKYRKKLESLYSKDLSLQQKREAKESTFRDLKDEYKVLKEKWEGYSGYDFWFHKKINNARMITVSTYYDLVPAFLKIMEVSGNDMEKFYIKCQELAKKPKEERLSLIADMELQTTD